MSIVTLQNMMVSHNVAISREVGQIVDNKMTQGMCAACNIPSGIFDKESFTNDCSWVAPNYWVESIPSNLIILLWIPLQMYLKHNGNGFETHMLYPFQSIF